jgi:hypothetical protein
VSAQRQAEPIRALPLLRRGLAASPELRQGIAATLLLALLAGGGRVITPVLVQQVIDHHVNVERVRVAGMLPLAALGVVMVLVTAWAARTTNQRLAHASERALCGLRVRAFNHIHALSMAHHTEEQRGALVSRVTSDVETLGQFFRWGGLAWIINSALMAAALLAMLVYDWRLTLVALATLLPIVLVLRVMQRKTVVAWDAVRSRVGEVLAAISESIQGAAVIRAYGVQAHAQRRVMATVERRRRAEIRAGTLGALFFPSGELFAVLTTAAVLVAGMALGPAGGGRLEEGPGRARHPGRGRGPAARPGAARGRPGHPRRAGVVRLPRRAGGADRGQRRHPRRHQGGAGRHHRLRQDHPGQAAHPARRPDRRRHPGGRDRPARGAPSVAALLPGDGPPGRLPVRHHRGRQRPHGPP